MTIDQSIFKAYDIRGIYPTQINEQNYPDIIRGIYTYFLKRIGKTHPTIVLGRDMRISGPVLFEIAQAELVKMGAQVIDIGLASTPTFYYAVANYGYDAGIQITASHNPKEYTGIKFAIREDNKILKIGKTSGMTDIQEIINQSTFAPYIEGGSVIKNDHILNDEIDAGLQSIIPHGVKKFKIIADPANGMGCVFLKQLFKHISADFTMMNGELDGTFPVHEPNPIEFKNLKPLIEQVVAEKADLGIAPDGDGDRIYFIDEKGNIITATSVTSIIAREILKNKAGETIIADIRDIRNVKEICQKYGGKFAMSIVGHAFITKQLNEEHAAFAGESSGHFYFRETGGAENSVRVVMYMLKAMSEENKPISAIVAENMTSFEHEEVNFIIQPPADEKEILSRFESDYSDGAIDKQDKLSVEYPDWRFNMRTSNTENAPILRLNVEGATKELVNSKFEELKDKLLSMGAKLKE
jgi:phosphomannomutase